MKDNEDKTSEGLNQIFEVINAKGDIGELNEILNSSSADADKENLEDNNELV